MTVHDPSRHGPGQAWSTAQYALASALQINGSPLAGTPSTLKTWTGPITGDTVALAFKQAISASEPLRRGTYSKTLTFTLSTTTP